MKGFDATDVGALIGLASVTYGLHLAWPPLAWMFAGGVVFAVAALASHIQKDAQKKRQDGA